MRKLSIFVILLISYVLMADPIIEDYEKLFNAVQSDDTLLVRELVTGGIDVDTPEGTYGGTSLKLSCLMNLPEMTSLLIELGANVNLTARDGNSPLTWASSNSKASVIVEQLLKNGADINHRNMNDENALIIFVKKNAGKDKDLKIANILIENKIDLNTKDGEGKTAIHYASEKGDTNIISTLLKSGADINSRDNDKNTPIIMATQNGHKQTVEFLLQKGADPNMRDYLGRGPEYFANQKNYSELVDLLKAN